MRCDTYEQMAERFNMSARAINYRVSKMAKKLGVSHRDEITGVMRELHLYGESNRIGL
jgi:DNA-binding CsgD family transcriptional regulator